mgnify:CR=1 FL=1
MSLDECEQSYDACVADTTAVEAAAEGTDAVIHLAGLLTPACRADPVLGFTRTDRAREVVTGPYREEWLDGAGHWIPQDHAADVNRILLEFLDFCGW